MKQLVTTSWAWKAIMLLFSLFVFSAANAQQPCGISVNPSDSLLFTSVQGAAAYKVVTVTNTSTAGVEVHVFTTGRDSVAFSYEPRAFELAAGATKEFKVYFKPNSANITTYGAFLNFSTNSGTVCVSVPMVGTGTFIGGGDKGLISDPGSFKYPVIDLGKQSCKTFIIKNTASVAATIDAIEVGGSEAFVINGTIALPITLQAGETYSLEVCYAPTEQSDFYATGKVSIEYLLANTSDSRKLYIALSSGVNSGGDRVVYIAPNQFKFPAVDMGQTKCVDFYVINRTALPVTVTDLAYEGSSVFVATPGMTLPVTLAAEDSLKITVCFTPTDSVPNDGWKGSISVAYTPDGGITTKHVTATFYSVYEKPACLAADEGDDWTEPILIGGKDDRVLVIVNKLNVALTINAIRLAGEDVGAFTINATPPITIPALGKVEIPFTFAPYATQNGYTKEKYIAAVVLSLSSDTPGVTCNEFETHVWGFGLRDQHDDSTSVAIPLYPNEKQTIGLSNRGIKESYTLLFVNNLDKDIIIQSISLADGSKFKITATNPSTTPFTLKPQETFTITIEFESADGLLYKDKLIIVSDFAATAMEFDLQGINAAAATVRNTLPEGVSVAVMPNPMRSEMTVDVEGIRSAKIEVSDVLGAPIIRTIAAGDWKWNGRMSNGAIAPAGTYFVRVQGESTSGERFVTTQRIVIER